MKQSINVKAVSSVIQTESVSGLMEEEPRGGSLDGGAL